MLDLAPHELPREEVRQGLHAPEVEPDAHTRN